MPLCFWPTASADTTRLIMEKLLFLVWVVFAININPTAALTRGVANIVRHSFSVTHFPVQDPLYKAPGDTVHLSCQVETHFDSCTWTHLQKVNKRNHLKYKLLCQIYNLYQTQNY